MERWPVLGSCPSAVRWLGVQADAGARRGPSRRTPGHWWTSWGCACAGCRRRQSRAGRRSPAYVRDLRERPGRRGANVVAMDSGAGLANATLQLRVTVVRLFFDFLVEERRPRPQSGRPRVPLSGWLALAGVVWSPSFESLPWIPTDAQWRAILEVAAGESLRNRLMFALAYDAALRREELCLLETDDLDPAHRTITVTGGDDEESPRPRGSVFGRVWPAVGRLSAASPGDHDGAGRAVCVRVAAQPRSGDFAVDLVEGRALDRGPGRLSAFSTHTLRHLCLTDLARSGWELHQIATFAGHQLDGHDAALHPSLRARSWPSGSSAG